MPSDPRGFLVQAALPERAVVPRQDRDRVCTISPVAGLSCMFRRRGASLRPVACLHPAAGIERLGREHAQNGDGGDPEAAKRFLVHTLAWAGIPPDSISAACKFLRARFQTRHRGVWKFFDGGQGGYLEFEGQANRLATELALNLILSRSRPGCVGMSCPGHDASNIGPPDHRCSGGRGGQRSNPRPCGACRRLSWIGSPATGGTPRNAATHWKGRLSSFAIRRK